MPTVLVFNVLRFTIDFNDHRPAHVHAMGRGCEARFVLNCPTGPVLLAENSGSSRREVKQILLVLTENLATLCEAWRRIHEF